MLGKIFQKSPKTIKKELERGMVEHTKTLLNREYEYNVYHAQIDAKAKMQGKDPQPKSGRHYALVERISEFL